MWYDLLSGLLEVLSLQGGLGELAAVDQGEMRRLRLL